MLYQLFPETILDFCIEYLLFRNSVLQLSLSDQLYEFARYSVYSMGNKQYINNPYLRYKVFDLLTMDKNCISFTLSLLCKRELFQGAIQLYIQADKISTPFHMRDRVNYFFINALQSWTGYSKDYTYILQGISRDNPRHMVEFLYVELGEMLKNFDNVLKNLNSVYQLRDRDDEVDTITLREDYKYRLFNSLVYLLNISTFITNIINLPDINELFLKRELMLKLICFIHYLFYKSNAAAVQVTYYDEYQEDAKNGTLQVKFNKLYKFCFKTYIMLSKAPLFREIVHEADRF